MKAFVECDKCGKKSSFQPDGLIKCPECGTSSLRRVVVGPSAPDWFRNEKAGK